MVDALKELFQFFRFHTDPVIPDGQQQIVFLSFGKDRDVSVPVRVPQTVDKGVLYNGLEQQGQDGEFFNRGGLIPAR